MRLSGQTDSLGLRLSLLCSCSSTKVIPLTSYLRENSGRRTSFCSQPFQDTLSHCLPAAAVLVTSRGPPRTAVPCAQCVYRPDAFEVTLFDSGFQQSLWFLRTDRSAGTSWICELMMCFAKSGKFSWEDLLLVSPVSSPLLGL